MAAAEHELTGQVQTGNLMAHAGASKLTREELALVPIPPATDTFKPIPHFEIINYLEESFSYRGIEIVRSEFAVTPDGLRMFGLVEIDMVEDGLRFSVGVRNGNDKTMRLGMVAGYRVFVCDNMAFAGDFYPLLAKHSKNFDPRDSIALGVERVQRYFTPLRAQIADWKRKVLSPGRAEDVFLSTIFSKLFPAEIVEGAYSLYWTPEFLDSFGGPTLWTLSNAYTSSFKSLPPVRQFQATAKLGRFLLEAKV